jgi:hypothetical protein
VEAAERLGFGDRKIGELCSVLGLPRNVISDHAAAADEG